MTTKQFHIGDILSITTGRLVSTRHIDGVYDILNWMTGDDLFTHQLPRASDEAAPSLRAQFPDLAAVTTPDEFTDKEHVLAWLSDMVREHGEHRDVTPLPAEDHVHVNDPIAELQQMMGPDAGIEVVVVGLDPNA